METILASLEDTKNLARDLAKKARRGDCFCLLGDLGAGKTEFARAFIRELGGDIKVSSPTFNIVQTYENCELITDNRRDSVHSSQFTVHIYHFDLYRLKSPNELTEIGLEEALTNGICLIEWPQIAEELLPTNRTEILFEIIDEGTRKITCS